MDDISSFARFVWDSEYRRISEVHLELVEARHEQLLQVKKAISAVLTGADDPEDPPAEYYNLADEASQIRTRRDEAYAICVVFAAMTLEAFIYDYAAVAFSGNYAKSYLDKLDLRSKWVVIPKLVCGQEIPRGSRAFSLLKELVAERNSLVHVKSREIPFGDDLVKLLKEQEVALLQSARHAVQTIEELFAELGKINPEHPKVKLISDDSWRDQSC